MLPRWHVLSGAIFTAIIWLLIPNLAWLYLTLIFMASFLIDFDHYANAVMKTKNLGMRSAFDYHKDLTKQEREDIKKGIKRRSDFQLFHTVEFHALVGLLGFLWIGFFYIFIGMMFHSMLDLFSLLYMGMYHRREYFFFNWAGRGFKQN